MGLADELRAEQDHTNNLSKTKRGLETQLAELENKFAEANENAIRGGRQAMSKLESRIRELEVELGNVQSHTSESAKYTRSLSVAPRSSPSRLRRTRRTRTGCPSWPPSSRPRSRPTRSRSRRPRRSLPSTWPSSGRPSRSWRRPRSEPGLLRSRCTIEPSPPSPTKSPEISIFVSLCHVTAFFPRILSSDRTAST